MAGLDSTNKVKEKITAEVTLVTAAKIQQVADAKFKNIEVLLFKNMEMMTKLLQQKQTLPAQALSPFANEEFVKLPCNIKCTHCGKSSTKKVMQRVGW